MHRTIIPPATLAAVLTERLPLPGDVRGYHAVVAKLERDAREDGRATVKPGRVRA